MIFSELRFFAFFALVFTVYWSLRTNQSRKVWLIACGLSFYAAWDPRFLSLILYQTGVDYVAARKIEATSDSRVRSRWLKLSLVSNLGLLAVFKYLDFFADSFASLAHSAGFSVSHATLNIVLPVGISFYTFQSLSYTIDVYRRRMPAVKSGVDFGMFVTFFPQLVAGPIVRAYDFLPQLAQKRDVHRIDFRWALTLFLVGFFKKAGISDNISPYIDAFYKDPAAFDQLTAWLAATLYTVQIYCDFSGYTDMAIATAGLLGYRLCPNFNAPYLALDITDFWRRWHISLSSWLKDYLYVSLGGNRGGRIFTYRNLMLTMVLGGLWHGASWNFILWGFMHGLALVAHKLWKKRGMDLGRHRVLKPVAWLLTLSWVAAAWVPFRATSLGDTLMTLKLLAGQAAGGAGTLARPGAALLWGLILALLACHWVSHANKLWSGHWRQVSPGGYAFLYGMAWATVVALRSTDYAPFIYFQF